MPDAFGTLLALGLVPAWVYLSRRRQHVPAGARTTMSELLELFSVAVLTTGVALLVGVLASGLHAPGVVSIAQWTRRGSPYFAAHPVAVALNLAAVLAVAAGAAFALSWWRYRGVPEHDPDGDVWWKAFSHRPPGRWHYVAVALDDGIVIEGLLISYATEVALNGESRDVALGRPIRVTSSSGVKTAQDVDRIVVPEKSIRYVTSRYVDVPAGP